MYFICFFQPNPQIFILFYARLRDCFGVDVKYYWDEGFLKFDIFVALLQYKADWSSNSYYLELQLPMVTRPRYFRQNVSDLTRIWTYDSTNVIPPNDTCATKMLRINVCTYIELEGVQDLLTHWNTFFDTSYCSTLVIVIENYELCSILATQLTVHH